MELSLDPLVYVLIGAVVVVLAIVVYIFKKEKWEMPLLNETDYGNYWIPLPSGVERGRLTSARKTFERSFETAMSNAKDEKEVQELQKTSEEVLKQHLFAFKGSDKHIIFSNRNLIDEKLSYPTGRDERHLVSPEGIIDRGEHDGFQIVYLKMPDPDKIGIAPPERKVLSEIGEAIKFIRSTALNVERVEEATKERDFYRDESKLAHEEVATLRSRMERMARALAQKPLSSGEEPKVKGTLRSRLEAHWTKILSSLVVGGVIYGVCQQSMPLPYDPIVPAIIVGLVVFFMYPYIAKRF